MSVMSSHHFCPPTSSSDTLTSRVARCERTFRSYLRCTVRRWLNTFRVTTMYVSTPSTVSLYMPRNWGSSVLPWHSTINCKIIKGRGGERDINRKCGSEESSTQYEDWLRLYSLIIIIAAVLHHFYRYVQLKILMEEADFTSLHIRYDALRITSRRNSDLTFESLLQTHLYRHFSCPQATACNYLFDLFHNFVIQLWAIWFLYLLVLLSFFSSASMLCSFKFGKVLYTAQRQKKKRVDKMSNSKTSWK